MTPEEIKALRNRLKVSQETLAHMIGVTMFTVSRWERGVAKPSPLALDQLSKLQRS